MLDRSGRELKIGRRCNRFSKEGLSLKNQVVVTALREDGTIEYESMHNLQRGVTLPDRLEIIGAIVGGRSKNQPKKVTAYERDRAVSAEASERIKRQKDRKKL